VNPAHETQGGRILSLLSDGREHSNGEIITAPGGGLIGQYQRRLKDLRERGFAVSLGRQDYYKPNLWWYSWPDANQRQAWLAGRNVAPATEARREPDHEELRLPVPSQPQRRRVVPRRAVIATSGSARATPNAADLGLFAGAGVLE